MILRSEILVIAPLSFCLKVSTLDDDESGVRRLLVPAGSAHIARQTITGEKLSILLNPNCLKLVHFPAAVVYMFTTGFLL